MRKCFLHFSTQAVFVRGLPPYCPKKLDIFIYSEESRK